MSALLQSVFTKLSRKQSTCLKSPVRTAVLLGSYEQVAGTGLFVTIVQTDAGMKSRRDLVREGQEDCLDKSSKIIYNAVICNHCGDRVQSTHRYDFRYCSCGKIAVDGGLEYLRRVGDIYGYTEVSLYEGQEDELSKINSARPSRHMGML